MPTQYPPLLDTLEIKRGPRDLLGRYFLAAEAEERGKGITIVKATMQDLINVYERYEQSWNGIAPILDVRCAPIPDETSACFIGYDDQGEPAVTHAARVFDLKGGTLKQRFEDLSFWYGELAPQYAARTVCHVTAPTPATIKGPVMYNGGYWTRPDLRGTGRGRAVQEIARYYGYTQWDFSHDITVGSIAFAEAGIQERYGFDGFEPGFTISVDGKLLFQGLFMWARYQLHLDRLPQVIAASYARLDKFQAREAERLARKTA